MAIGTADYTSQPPPGFRFRPTDEELVGYYLLLQQLEKLPPSCGRVIAEVDLYTFEPWDLPELSHQGESETEWYFFCSRERKWAHGCRSNRATHGGFWKATGRDRAIKIKGEKGVGLHGMKKTIVFHKGRAPQGERTPWIIHEYRLEEGKGAQAQHAWKDRSWVLCKLFRKDGSSGKKQGEEGEGGKVNVGWEPMEVKAENQAEGRDSSSDQEEEGGEEGREEELCKDVKVEEAGVRFAVEASNLVWDGDWDEGCLEEMGREGEVTCVLPGLAVPELPACLGGPPPSGFMPRLEAVQLPAGLPDLPIFVGSPPLPTPRFQEVYLRDAEGESDWTACDFSCDFPDISLPADLDWLDM